MTFRVSKPSKELLGTIMLDGSKSISNRALIIRALCDDDFPIAHLSTSEDTQAMESLLGSGEEVYDVGPAGTTFRFLTAYLALQSGTQILTGSERMKQRPIGPLVDALNQIGANITYEENEGYPPLRIAPPSLSDQNELTIPANISSQFISALIMIAPVLPHGLNITLQGKLVSRSYLQMTLDMMAYFGIEYTFEEDRISIASQKYLAKPYRVESDWSAASYHYANAALAEEVDLTLGGLFEESMQGDAVTAELFDRLGLQSEFSEDGVRITRKEKTAPSMLEHDFILCPDIAQTMAVVCGALGIAGIFTGLETLSIKETDRIKALQTELAKVGVSFSRMPDRFSKKSGKAYYVVEGKADWELAPRFPTYHDHRMAMAFAPLSTLGPILIEDPKVVGKSYPDFWKDLTTLGWQIQVEDL